MFLITDPTQTTQEPGSWLFDSVIQDAKMEWPWGIACDSNAGIIVADYTARTVHVYNEDGVYQRALDVGKGLDEEETSWPFGVVTTGTTCYLTDKTAYVRAFEISNGAYKIRWLTVAPGQSVGNKEAGLFGIAMDGAGNLLVGCTTSPAYISKHRNDGSHIHSFPVSIKPEYLAVTPQDTVIISGNGRAAIVNQALGETMHSVQYPDMSLSWGVHCHGNVIYVCDLYDAYISCLSVSGEYIGCIHTDTSKYGDGDDDGCTCVCVNEEGSKMYVSRSNPGRVEVYIRKM